MEQQLHPVILDWLVFATAKHKLLSRTYPANV